MGGERGDFNGGMHALPKLTNLPPVVDGDRDRDACGDARREEMNSPSSHPTVETAYAVSGSEETKGEEEGDGGG